MKFSLKNLLQENTYGVTVTIVENKPGDSSSNSEQGSWYFT